MKGFAAPLHFGNHCHDRCDPDPTSDEDVPTGGPREREMVAWLRDPEFLARTQFVMHGNRTTAPLWITQYRDDVAIVFARQVAEGILTYYTA